MKTQAAPPTPPFKLFGRLHNWVDPGFVSCTNWHTHTHVRLQCDTGNLEDMVLWWELEVEEVTDARSGSFTVLIAITQTCAPSSLGPEPLRISLKWFFFPHFLFVVRQNQKSVAEEKVWSEVWLLDYFSQHGEDVWACHQACKFSNQRQQRSVDIF